MSERHKDKTANFAKPGPAIQNIPLRTKTGREVIASFTEPRVFCEADYSDRRDPHYGADHVRRAAPQEVGEDVTVAQSNENRTVYDSFHDHATEIAKLACTSRKRGKSDVWSLAFKRMAEAGAEGASVAFGCLGVIGMAQAIHDRESEKRSIAAVVWRNEIHTWLEFNKHRPTEAFQALLDYLDDNCSHLSLCEGVCDLCYETVAVGAEQCEWDVTPLPVGTGKSSVIVADEPHRTVYDESKERYPRGWHPDDEGRG